MSRQAARIALDHLVARPALIAPRNAGYLLDDAEVTSNGMLADLRELANADQDKETARWSARKAELCAAYGYADTDDAKPFAFSNGIAIIPIHGILINRFAWSWSFVTGYNFIRNQLKAAMADAEVTGILLDVNSYGGTVAGCEETADAIFKANAKNGGKKIVASVDANCFSAAYMITSQADRIYCTQTGAVGSIGVVVMHMDVSEALEKNGVKVTFIYAGAHKIDGNPYEPLSDSARTDMQARIDTMYDKFVATVARGRNASATAIAETEAAIFQADEALAIGLIDAVQNPDDAVEALFNADDTTVEPEDADDDCEPTQDPDGEEDPDDLDDDNQATQTPEKPMAVTPTVRAPAATPTQAEIDARAAEQQRQAEQQAATLAAATTQAATEARAAERTRISAIMGHADAAGRETLANHLAMNTDLSPEAAATILAASPKAAPPAKETTANNSNFLAAMNKGKHPNVGTGEGDGGEGEDSAITPGQRILATQARVSGYKPPAQKH